MKCVIESFMVPDMRYFNQGSAPAISHSVCRTHNWQCDGPVHDQYMCPIGRIEEARDNAIEEIRMAKDAP
jgi:hypothetical protein